MAGRNSQVSRIYCILNLLEGAPQGLSVVEITDRVKDRGHEASKRTIYRDLEALSQAGFALFPVDEQEGGQRWVLEKTTRINQYLVLSARELFALYLAKGVLSPLRDTPFYEDLQAIFQKFEERLGSKHREHLDSLSDELHFQPGPQWGLSMQPDILETVRAACSEGHLLRCRYYSVNSKAESDRILGPHYLYYARGGLYLVAEDLADHRVKVFALPRIRSAEMLEDGYSGQIITPEEMFNGSLGVYTADQSEEITIEFSPDVAEFVRERRWHPSQKIANLQGGRVRLSIEVSNTPELWQWILSFGPNAEVISPANLREQLLQLIQQTAKRYLKTG